MQITMKQARVGAEMTQKQMAEQMGVHVQTYMRMESHPEDVTIKQGKLFSRITGVRFEDLFFAPDSN